MLEPQKLPPETIPNALKQAQHYRLLGEPALAESICRDILGVADGNEEAWSTLLLALTDQFDAKKGAAFDQANQALKRITNEYKGRYFEGIIAERWARAQLRLGVQVEAVEPWVRQALGHFQAASQLAPEDDPNPILRWNSCVRLLDEVARQAGSVKASAPTAHRDIEGEYGDDVPVPGSLTD